jgi:hypothetical protein
MVIEWTRFTSVQSGEYRTVWGGLSPTAPAARGGQQGIRIIPPFRSALNLHLLIVAVWRYTSDLLAHYPA